MLRYYIILFLLIPSTTFGATIYIDGTLSSDCTSGNYSIANRGCNGSDGNAYNDVQAALTASSTYDTINVRTGVVTSNVRNSNGIVPKAGQTWQTYSGDMGTGRATIQAGAGYRAVFWCSFAIHNVIIQNLILIGANEFCVYSNSSNYLTLNNLDVSGWNIVNQTFKHAFNLQTDKVNPAESTTVTNNYIHDPANTPNDFGGIVIANPDNRNAIIEHNTVEDVHTGIWMDVNASGTVRYNLIRNVARRGLRIEYLSNWTVTNNIVDGSLDAMSIREMDASETLNMSHNTIYDCNIGLWISDINNYKLENSNFDNNIFMCNSQWHHLQVADDIHLTTTNTYYNNLFYNTHANDVAICWGDEAGTTLRDCHAGATSYDDTAVGVASFNSGVSTASGNINGDPLFKDAANGDFNLVVGSPAINAATDGKDIGAFNQPTVSNVDVQGSKVTLTWDIEFTPIQNCDSSKFTVTVDNVGVSVRSCSDINDTQTELTLASSIYPNQKVELTGTYGCVEDSEGIGRIGSYGLNGKARAFSRTIQNHAEESTLGLPQNFRLVSGNSP